MSVYMNGQRPALSGQRRKGTAWLGTPKTATVVGGGVRVRELYACVRDVFAIYDNDILPRLIMIII